ncbi:MAG TPA: hypothetical protein VMV12_08255 [Candidatus Micrarchaeaceae archaeon]|nr:hypothetical protein [Candidatus Micrarchaeaceae archaeon]
MATQVNLEPVAAGAARSRLHRPVGRAQARSGLLSPSYQPMWSLADQSIETVDKGIRILPSGFTGQRARHR